MPSPKIIAVIPIKSIMWNLWQSPSDLTQKMCISVEHKKHTKPKIKNDVTKAEEVDKSKVENLL